MEKHDSDSDSDDSTTTEDENMFAQFAFQQGVTSDHSNASNSESTSTNHRSAQNHRSANEWTLVTNKKHNKRKQVRLQNKKKDITIYMSKKELRKAQRGAQTFYNQDVSQDSNQSSEGDSF